MNLNKYLFIIGIIIVVILVLYTIFAMIFKSKFSNVNEYSPDKCKDIVNTYISFLQLKDREDAQYYLYNIKSCGHKNVNTLIRRACWSGIVEDKCLNCENKCLNCENQFNNLNYSIFNGTDLSTDLSIKRKNLRKCLGIKN